MSSIRAGRAHFLPETRTCVSSAYCMTYAPAACRLKSFANIVKRSGPREEPWKTPWVIGRESDVNVGERLTSHVMQSLQFANCHAEFTPVNAPVTVKKRKQNQGQNLVVKFKQHADGLLKSTKTGVVNGRGNFLSLDKCILSEVCGQSGEYRAGHSHFSTKGRLGSLTKKGGVKHLSN